MNQSIDITDDIRPSSRAGNARSSICLPALLVAAILFPSVHCAHAAVLTHRYPFTSNANDVVGGANGILLGNTFLSNGAAFFNGTNSGVQLPANLFTNYDNISFEAWFVDQAASNSSALLYTFAPSGPSAGMFYQIFGQGGYWTSSFNPVTGSWTWSFNPATNGINIPLPVVGLTNHLVWTQESNSQTARLYVNGVKTGENTNFAYTPALVGPTAVNWIGNGSAPNTSGTFRGSILEFRVHQGALSPLDVAVSDAAGPDQLPPSPGALQATKLILPASFGPGAALQPRVFADFAGLSNVNVSGLADLVLSSDNTNTAVIDARGRVVTLAAGTANITAAYGGLSNTVALAVITPPGYELAHRYNFGEPVGSGIAFDSAGSANARVFGFAATNGGPQYNGFNGTGGLNFTGFGWAALPAGIISSESEITVEAWLTWNGGAGWQRVFDFGSSTIQSYLYLTTATGFSVTNPPIGLVQTSFTTNGFLSESPVLDSTGPIPVGIRVHLAVAYSYPRRTAALYLNGARIASGTVTSPLAALNDTNNYLGHSQFVLDPRLNGLYDEFRIYRGFLQDADIAADYAAGPNAIGTYFVLSSTVSGTTLTLSWGPVMANWILQSSPAVDPNASWSPVNTTTNFQNNRYSVTLPISGNSGCFRLQQGP